MWTSELYICPVKPKKTNMELLNFAILSFSYSKIYMKSSKVLLVLFFNFFVADNVKNVFVPLQNEKLNIKRGNTLSINEQASFRL